MALKIRMSRGGRKKRPFYSVVVADSRMARDGRYLEKVGTYDPLLPKDSEERVKLNAERIEYWLGQGAQPSDRVAIFLGKAGITEMPAQKNNPEKAKPKAAALQRIEDKQAKAEAKAEAEAAAKEEAEAAAAAPAEETPAEAPAEEANAEATDAPAEEAATEAPAEEAKTEETAAEETPAEESKAEETPAEEEKAEEASEEDKKTDAA